MTTQSRPSLSFTVQQFAATPMGAVLALQIQTFAAAGTLGGQKDLALCDTTTAGFVLTLPDGASVVVGKAYAVKITAGANAVTLEPAGAGTIDGAANYVLAAGEAATVVATSVGSTGLVTWSIVSQTAPNPAAGGELLAANNLSDVVSASTSRANIGANRIVLSLGGVDLIGANARTVRYVHRGASATIVTLDSALTGPLDNNATITASINGTPITGGAITITAPGVAGDIDSATPSAANVIAAGQVLELTVGGTNTLAVAADISVAMTY